MSEAKRPGYKSAGFWAVVATNIIAVLIALGYDPAGADPGSVAKAVGLLVGFLSGFVGSWFRNGDYQQEFLISQGNAKHHLRELRAAGLIEQQGIKKGAKYHLQFHAETDLFADPLAAGS